MKVRVVMTDIPGGVAVFLARRGDTTIIMCDRVAFPALSVEEQLSRVDELFASGPGDGGTPLRLVA